MLLPLRGGRIALAISWDMGQLVAEHREINRALEEAWASLLTVTLERWPDWPVEVWCSLGELPPSEEAPEVPRWEVRYLVSFAGEEPDNRQVAAMVAFSTEALGGLLKPRSKVGWGSVTSLWKPLWAIDDGTVYRLLAPERSTDPSIYLVGQYSGKPALFAAAIEAWPLQGARTQIELADVDLGWAFEP